MDCSISASASTIRTVHQNISEFAVPSASASEPSSPRSGALPSPPDSPSSDSVSVSSFPSASSSFFFSSAAASPPHSHSRSDHAPDTHGLIIPSLTLGTALAQPTHYGKTLGDIRLILLNSDGDDSFSHTHILEDNEDIVDVGPWEEVEHGRLLRASTDWIEHNDPHGLEKFEPTRNVEILELSGYDHNANTLVERLKALIQTPFHAISEVLDPAQQSTGVVGALVSSSSTPLHTALLVAIPSCLSAFDQVVIDNVSSQIPVILFPSSHRQHRLNIQDLSFFRPSSTAALRTGLFRSPETLTSLRSEAADRFLRWREIERAVNSINSRRRPTAIQSPSSYLLGGATEYASGVPETPIWNKSNWESEWESRLSQDVALRLRESLQGDQDGQHHPYNEGKDVEGNDHDHDALPPWIGAASPTFDPLHLPSLFIFSISLLAPLGHRLERSVTKFVGALGSWEVRCALVGGFCIGLGTGLVCAGR